MYSKAPIATLHSENVNPDTPVLRIRHLNFAFGSGGLRKQILFDVDFDLSPGEIVILEGPSGSGKTTLLTLACGLRRFTDGSVRVFGEEIRDASDKQLLSLRRRIGFVFQHHNLLPFLTARRNVELVFQLWPNLAPKEAVMRSQHVLEMMGLQDRLDSYPAALSGGQKQRVAIARAIAAQPDLVLADEPTASLDKESGRQVVDLLQKMARSQRIPILLVTHDNRILNIADRIVRIEDGRVQ
jgi:putative ABC transport system ATP-binding protein